MKAISYQIYRILGKIFKDGEQKWLHHFFRKQGIQLGEGCRIYSNIISTEPYLITIGNNVTISNDVLFLTHDNSVCKCIENATDIFGEIHIGSNCFIGARSTILYGVKLADSIIVAAGSVVTNSFKEEGIIVGGVPAKKIGTIDSFIKRYDSKVFNINGISNVEKRKMLLDNNKLVEK